MSIDITWFILAVLITWSLAQGLFLIIIGIVSFIGGNFIGGLRYFLIGMFIRSKKTRI